MNLFSFLKLKIKNNYFYLKNNQALHNTVKIKNTKIGKNVVLIATGRSLSIIDFKKLIKLKKKNYDFFSVGGFLGSPVSNEINIDYYLLSDKRTIFPNKYDLDVNFRNAILKTNMAIMQKKIKLFLPTCSYEKHDFINNKIYYFNNFSDKVTNNISDITKYYGYNSISGLKALSACIYLGYDKIYFIGLDNDYWNNLKVNSSNEILQINRHFYDDNKLYKKNTGMNSVSNLLTMCSDMFKSYEKFKKFNIINLDPNGLIDCFSKKHDLDIYN
jgi:hypothetical protein